MSGRDGAERFPQATDVSLENALYRSLRELDPDITMAWVKDHAALYDEEDLIRARNATLLARPANVRAFFQSRLRSIVPVDATAATKRPVAAPLRPQPIGDPYGD